MKRNIFLRVKIKSLAEEARIIRIEERRANEHKNYQLQNRLHLHRTGNLRAEVRATLLAYQYLRGKPYDICERGAETKQNPIDWEALTRMVIKYGEGKAFSPKEYVNHFSKWRRGSFLKAA